MNLDRALEISRELLIKVGPRADDIKKLMPRKENTARTAAVKAVLEELGEGKYHCLYSNKEKESHEFLVDFTWWDPVSSLTVLACESEFGRKPISIGEDFDKLLSVKAEFKMMIFNSYQKKSRTKRTDQILQELILHFRAFGQHIKGEIYILMDTADLNDKTRTRMWQCVISKSGKNAALVFKPVATQT